MAKKINLILVLIVTMIIVITSGIFIRGQRLTKQQISANKITTSEVQKNDTKIEHQHEFVSAVAKPAIAAYNKNPQVLPSIVIAQAILESNWGQSKLYQAAFNPFGIKGEYNGQSISYQTNEYIDHKNVTIVAAFRKYPSLLAAITDHNQVVSSNFIKQINILSYQKQANLLQTNGYATDKDYAKKLCHIIKVYNLSKYDLQAINN